MMEEITMKNSTFDKELDLNDLETVNGGYITDKRHFRISDLTYHPNGRKPSAITLQYHGGARIMPICHKVQSI